MGPLASNGTQLSHLAGGVSSRLSPWEQAHSAWKAACLPLIPPPRSRRQSRAEQELCVPCDPVSPVNPPAQPRRSRLQRGAPSLFQAPRAPARELKAQRGHKQKEYSLWMSLQAAVAPGESQACSKPVCCGSVSTRCLESQDVQCKLCSPPLSPGTRRCRSLQPHLSMSLWC